MASPTHLTYDLIVAGLGVSGAATAWQGARAGLTVLGLDRYEPPHTLGSSHGETRIIREAYFESPLYVPLVREAFRGWAELARAAGVPLLRRTGAAMIGDPEGSLVRGSLASVARHGIPHRVLDADALRWAFPALDPFDGMIGVVEEAAGVLAVEPCVEAALATARRAGAQLRYQEPLVRWEATDDGVEVSTERAVYRGKALVLAVGPWLASLEGPRLPIPLEVERQVVHWYQPGNPVPSMDPGPVTIWEYDQDRYVYSIPETDGGIKMGLHHEGTISHPDQVDRAIGAMDRARLDPLVRQFFPRMDPTPLRSSVCLYTNTPDGHFILGRHPAARDRVILLSACSGHGFKFAPVLGRLALELATGQEPQEDLTPFSPDRFL